MFIPGALYVRSLGSASSAPLFPMLFGGGQERNYRPGTENTGMIAGLGKAAELVIEHLEEYEMHMMKVKYPTQLLISNLCFYLFLYLYRSNMLFQS